MIEEHREQSVYECYLDTQTVSFQGVIWGIERPSVQSPQHAKMLHSMKRHGCRANECCTLSQVVHSLNQG